MELKTIIAKIIDTADNLDQSGYIKEADELTRVAEYLTTTEDEFPVDPNYVNDVPWNDFAKYDYQTRARNFGGSGEPKKIPAVIDAEVAGKHLGDFAARLIAQRITNPTRAAQECVEMTQVKFPEIQGKDMKYVVDELIIIFSRALQLKGKMPMHELQANVAEAAQHAFMDTIH